MLTAQSQKADYYHLESLVRPSPRHNALKKHSLGFRTWLANQPGGDCWETTQQISFSLAIRERIRDCTTTCATVRHEAECLRARDT